MDELYRLVGIVMHNAQAIERNLSLIVYYNDILSVFGDADTVPDEDYDKNHASADELYEDMSWMTMGEILKLVSGTSVLEQETAERISRVLKHRNYVAHGLFKEDVFCDGGSLSQTELSSMKERLAEEVVFSSDLNADLLKIVRELVEEYEAVEQL